MNMSKSRLREKSRPHREPPACPRNENRPSAAQAQHSQLTCCHPHASLFKRRVVQGELIFNVHPLCATTTVTNMPLTAKPMLLSWLLCPCLFWKTLIKSGKRLPACFETQPAV